MQKKSATKSKRPVVKNRIPHIQQFNNVDYNDLLNDSFGSLDNIAPRNNKVKEEWLVEDQVLENNTKSNMNNELSKYRNLNLADIFSVSLESASKQVKLSNIDQDLAIKLSVNENKLEKMENELLGEEDDGEQASIDVFCVIDRSGSMSGKKLQEVKNSLHYLLDLLKPDDRISIILFDTVSDLILRPKKVGSSRAQIEEAIDFIKDRNATNIAAGLETAFNSMIERKTKNQITGVLLLSDGQDNQYFRRGGLVVDQFFAKWDEKMSKDEYTLHSFGYGNDHDENLLNEIAQKKGGTFNYVKDIELVSDSFVDCLAGLTSVVGKNAVVDIDLLSSSFFPEIRFKKTYGSQFSGSDMIKRTLTLNNLTKGYNKDFVFEITLDRSENTEIIQGTVEISVVNAKLLVENFSDKKFEVSQELKIVLHNGSTDIVIEKNDDVMKNLLRVKATEQLESCQSYDQNHQYDQAIKLLDDFEDELELYKGDAVIDNIKNNISKRKQMSSNNKYGIRNNLNVAAFTQQMCNAYSKQESNCLFDDGLYMNREQKVMKSKLCKMKR